MLLKLINWLSYTLSSKANKLYELLLKVGRFLRVIDEHFDQLSLVNIACVVIIIKVAAAAEPSVADLGALFMGLLAHYGKRRLNMKMKGLDAQQNKDIEDTKAKVKELGDRVGSIAAAMGFKNLKQ